MLLSVCLLALGCDSSHLQPLPRLEAPANLSEAEEALLIHTHINQYSRAARDNYELRFDSKRLVYSHIGMAVRHLLSWQGQLVS